MTLLERTTREVVESVMAEVASSDESDLLSSQAEGRLREVLRQAVRDAVDEVADSHPVVAWSVKLTLQVVEGAATDALVDWNLRRAHLLKHFVDPAIVNIASREGHHRMAAFVVALSEGRWLGCGMAVEQNVRTMRREMLEHLDRPPVLSDDIMRSTAEAMAWMWLQQ